MATAKYAAPSARSASLVTTELDSLADGSESNVFTYDNSSNRDLYAAITIKLGSITPASGGSIGLRIMIDDGTDAADKAAGDLVWLELASGASAKVVIAPRVVLYPFSMRFSILNESGATLNAANNDVYLTPYNEDIA